MRSPCHQTVMTTHSKVPRRYRCCSCGRTYTARLHQMSYGSKLKTTKVLAILYALRQGQSIRFTAKSLKLSPSTVNRWKKRFHADALLFNPQNHER